MSGRGGAWWAERSLLAACAIGMVLGARASATEGEWRLVFVACALVSSVLVWRFWCRGEVSSSEVLVGAVLLRLLAFPLLPSLSDDGYRYLWDGMVQVEGINPYSYRPIELGRVRGEPWLLERLNSSSYFSVYPPAAQLVFFLGGLVGWPLGWFVIKGLITAFEMAGVVALLRMVSPRAAVLYAWHPLAVVEIAGQGHLEGAMVGLLLLGVYAYRRGWARGAVASVTVAGWFKLYPLVLLPFLLRRVGWAKGWVALVVSAGVWGPYVQAGALTNIAQSLELYVQQFEFYAGPYYALKGLGWIITGVDTSKTVGPLLAGVGGLLVAWMFWVDRSRLLRLPVVWWGALGVLWATATTVHPWYLLGVLALLPLVRTTTNEGRAQVAAWFVLIGGALASYLFYSYREGVYWAAVWIGWVGWGGRLMVAGFNPLLQKSLSIRGALKASWVRPHLSVGRVLDLGAGEGYVGEALHLTKGVEVVLADVVDFNRSSLPHVTYDGHRLPFSSDSFGAVLLVFVLHHAANPAQVILESRRVTSGRVVVVESVFRNAVELAWLRVADQLANRLRGSGALRDQEEHVRFRRASEWRSLFAAAGLEVVHEEERGGWWHRQRLFVLEPA